MCRGARWVLGQMSGGVADLLGYANAGTQFLFGALATDRLGQMFAIQALPVIIFFAALVSILYHVGIMQLDRALDRRRDRDGDRRLQGRIAVRRRQHLRRPERIAARHPPLSGEPLADAGVRGDDQRHGGRRRHDPRGLCLDGDQDRLSAGGELHVGAGRPADGQDDHARPHRSARAGRADRACPGADQRPGPGCAAARGRGSAPMEAHHGDEKPANIIMAAAQGRADRRPARGGGRRDGAGVRRAGGARQRAFDRRRPLVRDRGSHLPAPARLCLRAGDVPAERAVARSRHRGRAVRREDRARTNSSPISRSARIRRSSRRTPSRW